jgi:hypothetical protein
MRDRVHADTSELRNLLIDISGAKLRVQLGVTKVLDTSRRIVEREMKLDARGHEGNWFGKPNTQYAMHLSRHVSSELLTDRSAEIGIEAKGSGKLAHLLAYGSVNNAPVYDHTAGLRRAEPRIVRLVAGEGEESVLGGKRR